MNTYNKPRMFFTSWDANTFLCLMSLFPEDVVRGMIKMVKEAHEKYVLDESRHYHRSRNPWDIIDPSPSIVTLKNNFDGCVNGFKKEWSWRASIDRRDKVVEWCQFGDDWEMERHQNRFGREQSKALWDTWNAWGYCEHPPRIMSWATSNESSRRNYVSTWYDGIHEGRYYLFFRPNILSQKNKSLSYQQFQEKYSSIFSIGPYQQLIEDLECLDGPGIGESPASSTVEHIDDIFSTK